MQERHINRKQYFEEQGITTSQFVIPYIQEFKSIQRGTRVLEIGCGEGGNLAPFIEMGCETVGVDINEQQILLAQKFVKEEFPEAKSIFIARNIYSIDDTEIGRFDIIMLRDVIEHIPEQDRFFKHVKKFLDTDGVIFFGFPPWRMPFGGHQQICSSKFLSKLPYFHILPNFLYVGILKLFGASSKAIEELLEIKATQMSIHRFNRLVVKNQYQFLKQTYWLINPNYEIKFGLKPRIQLKFIQAIPYFRDFLTTCYYSLIRLEKKEDTSNS